MDDSSVATVRFQRHVPPLLRVLVKAIVDIRTDHDLMEKAAALIIAKVRFTRYFLHAKPTVSDAELEELLNIGEEVDSSLAQAWAGCDGQPTLALLGEPIATAMQRLAPYQRE